MSTKNEHPMRVVEIIRPKTDKKQPIPAFLSRVQAGFPSPADDYIEDRLDLNDLIISKPAATFFVRVEGESMQDANIYSGDILVIDRSIEPVSGKIVVAVMNGEFTVKRFVVNQTGAYLMPENPKFRAFKITPDSEFQIWGVVTYVIHKT